MTKRILTITCAALLLLLSTGCGGTAERRPVETQKIKVHEDQRFKVVLECNRECGSKWKLGKRTDSDIVLFVDSELVKDPTPADQSNAYDVWTFMAQNPGHTEIILNSTKKTRVFTLDVIE